MAFSFKSLLVLCAVILIINCRASVAANKNLVPKFAVQLSDSNNNSNNIFKCSEFTCQILQTFYTYLVDPFLGLELNNLSETIINNDSESLEEGMLNELEHIRAGLLWNIVIPKGSDILVCAADYSNSCEYNKLTVQSFLDELYATNETVSDLSIFTMVERVRWTLPPKELVTVMANLSQHLRQNIDAMLALYEYNEDQFVGEAQMYFLSNLMQLKNHTDYTRTVSKEKQERVDALFPSTIQTLLDGQICLNQHMTNGSKFYIHLCPLTKMYCAMIYPEATYKAVFKVTMSGYLNSFSFKSPGYTQRPIYLYNNGLASNIPYLYYNVYIPDVYSNNHLDWKVQLDGSQLVIKSMNESLLLCAGSELTQNQGYYKEWYAYTRNASVYEYHKSECRWNVEDCRAIN